MKARRDLGSPLAAWRPGQRLALRTILAARTPHVVLNAPTGAGKSVRHAACGRRGSCGGPTADPDASRRTATRDHAETSCRLLFTRGPMAQLGVLHPYERVHG